jgi:hypothetical protein
MDHVTLTLQHLKVAVGGIAYCLVDLAEVILQGQKGVEDHGKRGNIAAGLEREAYRIRHGTTDGFKPNPARPRAAEEIAAEKAASQPKLTPPDPAPAIPQPEIGEKV